MKFLNLGCGQRYHTKWTNVDFRSCSEFVIAHDLSETIPIENRSFDFVYHSHLLEHFTKDDAQLFLAECFRVLRPGGILRVVVPDLEQTVRLYLEALEQATAGSVDWDSHYDWMLIELLDQLVRNSSKGMMADYLSAPHVSNQDFVVERLGTEFKRIIGAEKRKKMFHSNQPAHPSIVSNFSESMVKPIYRFFRYTTYRREFLLKALLGKEFETLELGRFRKSGEIHQWMYDSFSLKRLLERSGFVDAVQRTATESYFSDWTSFTLDTEPDGSIYKPDSLFMEAIKPSA